MTTTGAGTVEIGAQHNALFNAKIEADASGFFSGAGAESLHIIDSTVADPIEAIRELTDGGVDLALDTFGGTDTTRQAVGALRRNGVAHQGLTKCAGRLRQGHPVAALTLREIAHYPAVQRVTQLVDDRGIQIDPTRRL